VALRIEDKKAIVKEVAEVASQSLSAVAAEYRGLTVEQLTRLRVKAREAGVYVRVVRNTLARKAVSGTSFECMQESLVGPLLLGFAKDEPGAAARLFRDFAKENDKLVIKVLSIDGQLLTAQDVERVAGLPTKLQAISLLLSVLQAPVTKTVRTLSETYAQVVRVVAAVGDQKQANH